MIASGYGRVLNYAAHCGARFARLNIEIVIHRSSVLIANCELQTCSLHMSSYKFQFTD